MQKLIYYIYTFSIKESGKVIYVGSTRQIGARINEHRRSQREKEREQPIHEYLNKNNLKLIKDVSINIIDMAETKEEALELEKFYFEKYKNDLLNIWKAEDKDNEYSPIRQPLKVKGEDIYFTSQRDAAEKLGVSRYKIKQMTERGELEKVEIRNSYVNEMTNEMFINAYQIKKRYNLDAKTINKLSKEGKIIINGMIIRKV